MRLRRQVVIRVLAFAQMSMASSEPAKRELRRESLVGRGVFSMALECRSLEEAAEAGPSVVVEAAGNGLGFGGGVGEAKAVCGAEQEVAQVVEGGLHHALPDAEAFVGRLAEDAVLDSEQLREPEQGGIADAGCRQLVEFPPRVDVAELQGDRAAGSGGIGEHVVCGVFVDLRQRT